MKALFANTESFIKRDRTRISTDVAAGSTVVITVANANLYAINDYIVVGYEGSEQAELCLITAVSGDTLTVATLVRAHLADEPIVKYRYNKRKFYGCVTATGTFVELTANGSPVTIQVTDPQGAVLEYTGVEGYLYFKSTYYNSTTTEESAVADAEAVLANESLRYCSIYAIKHQAGLNNNPYIVDGNIETYRKRAENEVNSYVISRYQLPLTNSDGDSEVPWMIENITTLLAAGYMDWQEFGADGEGKKWLGEARSLLKKIQAGEQSLIGLDGVQMTEVATLSGVQSYPSSVDNTDGPTQQFTMRQNF